MFSIKYGVKQDGVLSPILFAIYTDCFLNWLQVTCVDCHMGHHFSGSFSYGNDLTLLYAIRPGLATLVKECEKHVTEYDIIVIVK